MTLTDEQFERNQVLLLAQWVIDNNGRGDEQKVALARELLSLDARARALRHVVQQYFDNHFVLRLTESERQMLEALKAFDAETPTGGGGDDA